MYGLPEPMGLERPGGAEIVVAGSSTSCLMSSGTEEADDIKSGDITAADL